MQLFTSLNGLINAFDTEEKAIAFFIKQRWPDGVICPFCLNKRIYHYKDGRYRCRSKDCDRIFSYKTGSVLENSKVPVLKWLIAQYLLISHKKGISSYQLAEDIQVTQRTAWFMMHRIREVMRGKPKRERLTGIIQTDETWIGGKNRNRHKDKKVKYSEDEHPKDKILVMGLYQMETKTVRAVVIPDRTISSIESVLKNNVKADSTIMSDEWKGYGTVKDCYIHMEVNHKARRFVSDEGATTNSIENFWSHVKRTIFGVYHHIPKKHLQRYVDECVFRFNTREMKSGDRIALVLGRINGTRLKYKDLVSSRAA